MSIKPDKYPKQIQEFIDTILNFETIEHKKVKCIETLHGYLNSLYNIRSLVVQYNNIGSILFENFKVDINNYETRFWNENGLGTINTKCYYPYTSESFRYGFGSLELTQRFFKKYPELKKAMLKATKLYSVIGETDWRMMNLTRIYILEHLEKEGSITLDGTTFERIDENKFRIGKDYITKRQDMTDNYILTYPKRMQNLFDIIRREKKVTEFLNV